MMKEEAIKRGFLITSILLSIFAQISNYHTILSNISYVIWIITFYLYVLDERDGKTFHISKIGIINILLVVVLFLYSAVITILNNSYISSNLLRVISLPLLPYLIGIRLSKTDMGKVSTFYIIGSIILAIWININFFGSFSIWANSQMYIYAQKNPAAQIFSTSIILLMFNFKNKGILRICLAAYLFFIICILQCRTAIIALLFAFLIYIYTKSKHKIRLTILLVCLIGLIYYIPQLNLFLSHVFLIDKYVNASLNTFSSNRMILYHNAYLLLKNNLFLGVGNYYVDNFYLNALLNYGLIVGGLLIIYTLYRFYKNIFGKKCQNNVEKCLLLLTVYYFVTSLSEAYPPFGPGTCSLMFWLFSSYYDKRKHTLDRKELLSK